MAFSRISEEDVVWLERPFNEDEVYGVSKGFNSDKAPSLNGFSMSFQTCWGILRLDIMDLFHNFNIQAMFEKDS